VLDPWGILVVRADGSDLESVLSMAAVDVIIAGSRPRFDRGVLERLGVRAIVRAGIGVDAVDVATAASLGIQVSNVPDYGTESVAQHAVALALAGSRRLIEADRLVRDGSWGFADLGPMHLPSGQTAGVLGQGRIGRRVAALFGDIGFGRVIGHDPYNEADAVEQVSFEDLLSHSDILSVHVPGGADPILGASEFARMKAGSVLVNTARGSLIDEAALRQALLEERPRVACLDVFQQEPPDIAQFDGVEHRMIFSPHQAWYTEESQADLRTKAAEEALRIISGQPRNYPVNDPETPR